MRCTAHFSVPSPRAEILQTFWRTDFKVLYAPRRFHDNWLTKIPCLAWRKVLKDLIVYFREIQSQYESRAKSLLKVSNVINNTTAPSVFLPTGGIDDALEILRNYHKTAIAEANKSKEIEADVILALVGLRSDLNQKIKEIKGLSGDFKNSVEKEDATRKAVAALQDGLGQADIDPSQITGKQDPYLLRLAVDRQVEKQIDEENYLHQVNLSCTSTTRSELIMAGISQFGGLW
jgi:hypothetical protein